MVLHGGITMSFPEKLKFAREKLNIKQKEAASLIEISDVTLSRYETGEREPKVSDLIKIARTLKTTVAYLVGETDIPEVTAEIPTRVGSPLQSTRLPLPVNEPTPARDSDVFATLGTLINQLEKTYPNMTEEDQKLARGLLNRCLRTVCSDLEDGGKREVI